MSLIYGGMDGWRINRINAGAPYHVEQTTPLPKVTMVQVVDARGTVALSGPHGAVFCASIEQADALCAAANAGQLEAV